MIKACLIYSISIGALLFLTNLARAQDEPAEDSLRLDISTNKRCYSRNETVRVTLKFSNAGRAPMYLYRIKNSFYGDRKYVYRTVIGAYDSEGKGTGGTRDPIYFSPARISPGDDFIKIAPGGSFSQVENYFLSGQRTTEDGKYFLAASYRSPVGEAPAYLNGKRVWTIGDRTVSSDSVEILTSDNCKRLRSIK